MNSFRYLIPSLSYKILTYIKSENLLPNFPRLELLSQRIAEKVVDEYERGEIPRVGEPDIILLAHAQDYVKKVAERISYLYYIKNDIDRFRVIVVIGAGLSFEAGLPLTQQLGNILKPIAHQDIISVNDLQAAFKIISSDRNKQKEFKERFVSFLKDGLESGRIKPTDAQELLINKFIEGKSVTEVICLNWDNLLEIVYKEKTGGKNVKKINRDNMEPEVEADGFAHCLWKFHGDVEDPNYDWVYPGTEGRVFSTFIRYYENIKSKATFILLVIGYSELDETIKKDVIEMIEKDFTTYRIGMDLELVKEYEGKRYVLAPAELALLKLFKQSP